MCPPSNNVYASVTTPLPHTQKLNLQHQNDFCAQSLLTARWPGQTNATDIMDARGDAKKSNNSGCPSWEGEGPYDILVRLRGLGPARLSCLGLSGCFRAPPPSSCFFIREQFQCKGPAGALIPLTSFAAPGFISPCSSAFMIPAPQPQLMPGIYYNLGLWCPWRVSNPFKIVLRASLHTGRPLGRAREATKRWGG